MRILSLTRTLRRFPGDFLGTLRTLPSSPESMCCPRDSAETIGPLNYGAMVLVVDLCRRTFPSVLNQLHNIRQMSTQLSKPLPRLRIFLAEERAEPTENNHALSDRCHFVSYLFADRHVPEDGPPLYDNVRTFSLRIC